jgi:alkylation response protein AidB-like acyl-CoA dehydrogenase
VPMLLRAVEDAALPAAVATGRMRPCPALEPGAVTARAEGEGWRLEGSLLGLELVPEPTHYLLACPVEAAEPGLFLLPADAPGLAATRHLRIDGRLSADLVLHSPARLLARGEPVQRAVVAARDLGAFLTCVEAVSAMGALIEQTIAYLSARVQFGSALASFQALRHRVAEMHVAAENTRGLVAQLLREAGTAPALPWREVSFAKLRLGEAGRFVAEAAIQLHGGMGMTEALPASRLARRIMLAEFEYGDRNWHAARLLEAA